MNTLQLGTHTWVRWADPAELVGDEARAIELLSPDERSRYEATISGPAQERLLWGRLLLRELIAEQVGIRPADVTISARCDDCGGPHGQPAVTGPNDEARSFGLSVSGGTGMVIVAMSLRRMIGIDVEPRANGTTGRLQAIRHITGDTDDPLRHWTRVEAVLKADGRGLRVDPRMVRVHVDGAELDDVGYSLVEPAIDARFVISVAFGPAFVPAMEATPG